MDAKKIKAKPKRAEPKAPAAAPPPPSPKPSPVATAPTPVARPIPPEIKARDLRDNLVPTYLSLMLGQQNAGWVVARIYMNGFFHDAGNPEDPVEKLMLEQLVMAHHRLGKLHLQADAAKTPESQKILNTAAARLLGEFRRHALAIRQYRQPSSPRQFSVVHQQNIASGAKQEVSYVDRSDSAGSNFSFSSRTKLEDNAGNATAGQENVNDNCETARFRQVPGAGRGRANQRLQTAAVDD